MTSGSIMWLQEQVVAAGFYMWLQEKLFNTSVSAICRNFIHFQIHCLLEPL